MADILRIVFWVAGLGAPVAWSIYFDWRNRREDEA
jgi:hypothetical protein